MAIRAEVKVTLDPPRVSAVVGGFTREAVQRATNVAAQRTKANIAALGRVRTGAMLRSVRATPVEGPPLQPQARVVSDLDYTLYQERGTSGSVARPGKFLVWRGRSGALVFAKRTRGVPAGNFMRDAVNSLTPADFA